MTTSNHVARRGFLGRTCAAGAGGLIAARLAAGAPAAAPYWREDGWQIGCWTRPWAKSDYRVAMDAVREAGYKYIALTGAKTETGRVLAAATSPEDARKVGEEARKRGLQIPCAYGGRFSADKSFEEGLDGLRKMIDNCAAAGAWSALVSSLGTPPLYDRYCKVVAECCDYAAAKQVAIVLKPHGGLCGTGPQCRKAIERIAHKNFTLMYDPGNIYYYSNGEIDPVRDVTAVDGLVTSLSVKDYKHPKNVALTPGTGQVDFPALMTRLVKGGFTHGALLVETLAPGDPAHTLREARKARRFVERICLGAR